MADKAKFVYPRECASKGELYLVPLSMVARAFHPARHLIQSPVSGIGRDYDFNRLYGRLVLGIDRLWVASLTEARTKTNWDRLMGVVITSIGPTPKDCPRSLFDKSDKNTLTVHFVAGRLVEAWIDDAVKKITFHGEMNGCKQIFVLARRAWLMYAHPFYEHFERVGLARDRLTKLGRDMSDGQQRPGHFRLLCKDLPRGMGWECARHQANKVYMIPKKGEPHHGGFKLNDSDAANAGASANAAQ